MAKLTAQQIYANEQWFNQMLSGTSDFADMYRGSTPKEQKKFKKSAMKMAGRMLPMISIADAIVNSHYEPVDYSEAQAEARAGFSSELRDLMRTIQGEGDISAARYKDLLTSTIGTVAPAARQLQDAATRQFQQNLDTIDPNWRSRLKASGAGTDALVELANRYLSGEEASNLVTMGIAQTKQAQRIASDMLAGKLSPEEQKALDVRTAETVSQFGQWGNAGATVARGTMATANILAQQNLMMQGILAAQQAPGIMSSVFQNLGGIQQGAQGATAQQNVLAQQFLGPQVDVTALYGQTLGALSEYQVTPGKTLAEMGGGLYGGDVQMGISEIESNLAQKMSYFSGGLQLGADVKGMNMQMRAADKAAQAQQTSAMISGGAAIAGAATIAI